MTRISEEVLEERDKMLLFKVNSSLITEVMLYCYTLRIILWLYGMFMPLDI